jgi:hypothetical protein
VTALLPLRDEHDSEVSMPQAHAEISGMNIEADPEVRSHVAERGGLLFVRVRQVMGVHAGGIATLETTTDLPPDALEWRRFETRGLLVFVPRTMRLPSTLRLRLKGTFRRRVGALWNGSAYVL